MKNQQVMFPLDTVGARLKFMRMNRRLTQREMAEILEVSHSQYQKYESNDNALSVKGLKILNDVLEMSVDFLVTGKDFNESKNNNMADIRHNTQIETKIEKGCLVITTTVPLFKYVG